MNRTVSVIVAALAILTSQGMAQEQQEQKATEAASVVTKYDKMEKKQLQEELKRLQKEVIVAERAAKQARDEQAEAKKAYDSAPDDQKPDALLRMLEAKAKSNKPVEAFAQARSDFDAAIRAYPGIAMCGQASAQEVAKPESSSGRIALDGDCCVSLVEMHAYVKGEERYSSQWRGLRYLFLSEEEKIVFDSNPEKYAVAFGGLDIVATYGLDGPLADLKKISGTGRNTTRFDDRTYHFANEANFRLFTKNPKEYVGRAQHAAYLQAEAKRGKTLAQLYPNQ